MSKDSDMGKDELYEEINYAFKEGMLSEEANERLHKIVEQHYREPPKTDDEAMERAHEEGIRRAFGSPDSDTPVEVDELYQITKDAFNEYYNSLDDPSGTGYPDILKRVKEAGQAVLQLLRTQPKDEDIAYWMDLAHELGEKLQKRTVTREEVEDLVRACSQCGAVSDICKGCMFHATEWLKELGLEVEG